MKAFVKYDRNGKLISGSLILREKKPLVGNWKEIDAYKCCTPTTSTTTTTVPIKAVKLGYQYNGYAFGEEYVSDPIHTTKAHVLTFIEIADLVDFYGGPELAGAALKETGTSHWQTPNTGATNISGLNFRAAGIIFNGGVFEFNRRAFICPPEAGGSISDLLYNDITVSTGTGWHVEYAMSVRLVIDEVDAGSTNGTNATYTGNDGRVYNCKLINGIWYLAENLAETKFQSGLTIPIFTNLAELIAATSAGMTYPNFDENLVYS